MTEVPEGYEPAENSYAKNVVYDALYRELECQGFDMEDFDLIAVADYVMEELLAAGVAVPEDLKDPHGVR